MVSLYLVLVLYFLVFIRALISGQLLQATCAAQTKPKVLSRPFVPVLSAGAGILLN